MLPIRSEPEDDAPLNEAEQTASPKATKLISASLIMLFVYLCIRLLAQGMIQSFMALYLVDARGLSPARAGLYIGLNTLTGLVASPLGGFLAARFGEKRWLVGVLAAAYLCFGLALVARSNALFVTLYVSYGFFTFLGMAANSALVATLSPGKQRGLAYSLFFLPSSLMGVGAPFIAASIAENYGLASILYVSTAVLFVGLAVLKFGVWVENGQTEET